MKILAIRGKNLASLEGEFAVEFREEPLHSAGIFAITGNTGSGKSTLLDAMCIALFNNSPRINKVSDSADIADVKDAMIKEKDCRNILRRGTADGYAEADFLALDGKEYRARWSVRRSRNKADGKLQDYTYSLYNLSDRCEMQGTKTELLERVRMLIGLTFDQFTRAVLLAQGDFATFLKATSREKAEILEKLTGTEIYSRISQRIYEKCKAAEVELKSTFEHIKEISLLGDDEINSLKEEYSRLADSAREADKEIRLMQEKLNWSVQYEHLSQQLAEAQTAVTYSREAIEKAQPVIAQLNQIDSIEPIRNTYIGILAVKRQIKEGEGLLEQYGRNEVMQKEKLGLCDMELETLAKQQQKQEEEWKAMQPKIREAMRMEIQRKALQQQYASQTEVYKGMQQQLAYNEKKHTDTVALVDSLSRSVEQLEVWFGEHARYERLLQHNAVIKMYADEAVTAEKEIISKRKLQTEAETLLKKDEALLAEARNEAERLENTLSSKIAELRESLVEGNPCPVCGSLHHPAVSTVADVLNEDILRNAIKNNRDSIAHLTNCVDSRKTEITTLESQILGYSKLHDDKLSRATQLLSPIMEGEGDVSLHTICTLADEVRDIASLWQQKSDALIQLKQQMSLERNNLGNTMQRIEELRASLEDNKRDISALCNNIAAFDNAIETLIGTNESAEKMEQRLMLELEAAGKRYATAVESRNMLFVEYEKSIQLCNTTRHGLENLRREFEEHKTSIEQFIASCSTGITLEKLHTLVTLPTDEIQRMRNEIERLKSESLAAFTKYEERKNSLEKHMQSAARLAEDEDKAIVSHRLAVACEEATQRTERMTQISVTLKSDEADRLRTAQLMKNYAAMEEKAAAWRKLNDLLGSADGKKFRVVAQGYTLDIMLKYANIHLKELSSRYELARISPLSLAIKVIDLDMLSESRSVHSLSGGESFLVSLALALALSSLSSNRMRIESLFIDEGFGSLDSETLGVAMEALDRLQSQGRRIGIISHLKSILERIPTQIRITKGHSGRSTIKIEA